MLNRHGPGRQHASSCRRTAATPGNIAIDFINTEQVAPIGQPGPGAVRGADRLQPAGRAERAGRGPDGHQQGSASTCRPGDYQTSNKFQVYGKAIQVVGAGPWYTRFHTPQNQNNTDAGFRADGSANGSTFANFAFFGNYTIRIDGPGKVFDFANVVEHHHRQHLDRAHGLPLLGREHRQHDDQELAGSGTCSPTAST